MALGAAMKVLSIVLCFCIPQLLRAFVLEISGDQQTWRGYFLAAVLSAVSLVQVTVLNQYYKHIYTCGMQMRTAVFSAMYKKSLKLSAVSKAKYTVGEITNYISVDCQRFATGVQYMNFVWVAPLEVAAAGFFLYDLVGVSAFAGLAVLLLCVPVNALSMKFAQKVEMELLAARDKRIKLLNEALLGIKALKLYAWETPFFSNCSPSGGRRSASSRSVPSSGPT
jgi:ATP-binding cassette subfamily C (CFTR/MRP) protein 1